MYVRLAFAALMSVAATATLQPQNGRPHIMSLIDLEQQGLSRKACERELHEALPRTEV